MLQWMGGARRKVTSTRKSNQKRQKQYFEQRRRQLQVTDGGKDFEGRNTYVQQTENSRSLDILSLLNLSSVAKENKSTAARNESDNDPVNYKSFQPPQAIQSLQTNEVTPPAPGLSEVDEARSSSSYQPGNACPKMTPVSTFSNHARALNMSNEKMNQSKMVPENQEFHMIDILGDDEPNPSSVKSLEREAHAAFSVQGLGKVEMETPVHTPIHSPEVHGRTFFHGCSSPPEAIKPVYSYSLNSELVNLDFELDAMMHEVEAPLCQYPVEHSVCTKDRLDLFSKPKQESLNSKGFSLFDDNNNDFTDLIGDGELFYHGRESSRHPWDATSSSLPCDILDESAFGLSYNNWMDQTDASADYYSLDCMKQDLNFQGSYQQNSRNAMIKSGKLGPTESTAMYLKHQKSRNFQNFTIPEMAWNSPVLKESDVRDVVDQPTWSSFITEDTRDDLSLLSEESCSSSAVRGVSEKGTFNLKGKQAFKTFDFGLSENICSENNTFGRKGNHFKWRTTQRGENINWPRKFTRVSNPSRSEPAHNSNNTFEKRLNPENGRLFEAAYDPAKTMSGHSSYCQAPETTKYSCSNSNVWIEDLFGPSEDPNSYDSRSFFERFSKSPADCSPSCTLASQKHDIYEPKLENIMPRSSMLNSSEDCNMRQESLHADSCLVSEQQSITKEGDENSDIPVTGCGNFEQQREFSCCRRSSSSENGKSMDQAEIEDKCSDSKESTYVTSKLGERATEKHCLEHASETSPSVEISSMFDGNWCHTDTTSQLDDQTSLLCQTGFGVNVEVEGGTETSGVGTKRTGSDEQSGVDSTCQVMKLDSCVLQLFCIQVLKEASATVSGEKD